MFGSIVLEIALGLTLMYLALSLVCSALNEYYSTLRNRRGTHLRDAIAFLIDKDDPKGRRFLALFFSHPLVKGLSPRAWNPRASAAATGTGPRSADGDVTEGAIDAFLKTLKRTPAYIPDRTFAEVVVDILTRWVAPPHDEAASAQGGVPSEPEEAAEALVKDLRDAVATVQGDLAQAGLHSKIDEQAQALRARLAAATPQQAWDAVAATLAAIRVPARSIHDPNSRAAFLAVIDRWDTRLRTIQRDRVTVARVLREAVAATHALRGAIGTLPESLAKARLRLLLDEEEVRYKDPALASASLPALWGTVDASLAALRGAAAMVADQDAQASISALIEREAGLLTEARAGLVTLERIREAVADLPESEIKTTLRTLMDDAGDDLDAVKRNMERWYNNTMDRVSGWYKRNTQLIVFVIALGVSFGMNADTFVIANRLIRDPVLRATVAEAARGAIAEGREMDRRTDVPPGPAPAGSVASTTTAGGTNQAPEAGVPAVTPEMPDPFSPIGAPAAIGTTLALGADVSGPDGNKPREWTAQERDRIAQVLQGLDLPLGWGQDDSDKLLAVVGMGRGAEFTDGLGKLAGLLITTLALAMGAPFWYDVLGRFANVRGVGKRPEKTA